MKKQNLPQQTHFIGVLTPEDITLTLEDCRRYMNEAYGCRSGHLTPIHVTLIPPFRLPDRKHKHPHKKYADHPFHAASRPFGALYAHREGKIRKKAPSGRNPRRTAHDI